MTFNDVTSKSNTLLVKVSCPSNEKWDKTPFADFVSQEHDMISKKPLTSGGFAECCAIVGFIPETKTCYLYHALPRSFSSPSDSFLRLPGKKIIVCIYGNYSYFRGVGLEKVYQDRDDVIVLDSLKAPKSMIRRHFDIYIEPINMKIHFTNTHGPTATYQVYRIDDCDSDSDTELEPIVISDFE